MLILMFMEKQKTEDDILEWVEEEESSDTEDDIIRIHIEDNNDGC